MENKTNDIVFFNILSTIILSGINFFTIPIFTRLLGAEQYGYYSLFNAWLLIASCVMGLKTHSSIGTGIYTFANEYKAFRKSILGLGTGISLVLVAVCMIVGMVLPKSFKINKSVLLVFLICAFANYIIEFAQVAFTYEKKAKTNFVMSVALSLASVLISLAFILNLKNGETYLFRVYGMMISYVVGAIVLLLYMMANKSKIFNYEYWKYSFVVGSPIVFHSLSQNILNQSDRVMMQKLGCNGATIGIYSFYYTFSNVLVILLNALNNSWCPFYYDYLDKGNKELLKIRIRNYVELFTVLACGFLLISRELGYWFSGAEYATGINITPFLVIAIYLIFIYQFAVNFEFFNKKTKIIAVGTCFAGVVNIILNYFMIPKWGMYGAALATDISFVFLVIAHYLIANNIREMKFDMQYKHIVIGFLVICVMSGLYVLLKNFVVVRWMVAFILGLIEVYRIYKRKTIF